MNKFLILIAAFLLIIQFSNAQTTAGTQNLEFSLSYLSSKNNVLLIDPGSSSSLSFLNKTSSFGIGPGYAYFIANNLDIGGSLSYSSYTSDNSNTYTGIPLNESNRDLTGLVFIRKYFLYQNKIGFRTGLYLGYERQTLNTTNTPSQTIYDQNSSANEYSAGLRFDIVYYPLKHFGVTATLANIGYDSYKENNTTQGSGSGTGFNANFTNGLQLGMVYMF